MDMSEYEVSIMRGIWAEAFNEEVASKVIGKFDFIVADGVGIEIEFQWLDGECNSIGAVEYAERGKRFKTRKEKVVQMPLIFRKR